MRHLFACLIKAFSIDYDAVRRKQEYDYLAASKDLADLERRQRQLINSNLKGWV